MQDSSSQAAFDRTIYYWCVNLVLPAYYRILTSVLQNRCFVPFTPTHRHYRFRLRCPASYLRQGSL